MAFLIAKEQKEFPQFIDLKYPSYKATLILITWQKIKANKKLLIDLNVKLFLKIAQNFFQT